MADSDTYDGEKLTSVPRDSFGDSSEDGSLEMLLQNGLAARAKHRRRWFRVVHILLLYSAIVALGVALLLRSRDKCQPSKDLSIGLWCQFHLSSLHLLYMAPIANTTLCQ